MQVDCYRVRSWSTLYRTGEIGGESETLCRVCIQSVTCLLTCEGSTALTTNPAKDVMDISISICTGLFTLNRWPDSPVGCPPARAFTIPRSSCYPT